MRSNVASVVGAIVFTFNTAYLSTQTGQLTVSMGMALAPLVIYIFIEGLDRFSWKLLIVDGLVGFFQSVYEFRIFYITAWTLVFYLAYHLITQEPATSRARLKSLALGFLPLTLILSLSAFWIIGFEKTGALTHATILQQGLFGNGYLNISEALTLFIPWWTGSLQKVFYVQPIPVYFWLIPLAAFLGLLLNRKNSRIVFFGFLSLLGLFLTKQSGNPFPGVYLWLYTHFPGFSAYREASEFYVLIGLGYAVLIAALVNWVFSKQLGSCWFRIGRYTFPALISLLFLWNTVPLINGTIGTLFVARQIPKDYTIMNSFISSQSGFFRTYWVPQISRWGANTINHPEVSGTVAWGQWQQFATIYAHGTTLPIQSQLMSVFTDSYSEKLFASAAVKYVVVPLADTANGDNFFVDYGNSRSFYLNKLDRIPWLKRINIGTTKVVIYENLDFSPIISTSSNTITVTRPRTSGSSSGSLPQQVLFAQNNSETYRASILGASKPFVLDFSETFDPGWKLYLAPFQNSTCDSVGGTAKTTTTVTNTSGVSDETIQCDTRPRLLEIPTNDPGNTISLESFQHVDLNGYENAWKLDPSYIRSHFQSRFYKISDSGLMSLNLVIYYQPQSYFNDGTIISLSIFLLCGGVITYSYIRRNRRRKEPSGSPVKPM